MNTGRILLRLRKGREWSRRRLARESGIPHVLLKNFEDGDRRPNDGHLRILAPALGVELEVLRKGYPTPEEYRAWRALVNLPAGSADKVIKGYRAHVKEQS